MADARNISFRRTRIRAMAAAIFVSVLLLAASQARAQDANAASTANLTPNSSEGSGDNVGSESTTDLAKKLQNPIGNLYSFPFQSNTNFNYGPNKGTQEILNIQPVIPIHVNADWNIIARTILPLIWQPSLQPAQAARVTTSFYCNPSAIIILAAAGMPPPRRSLPPTGVPPATEHGPCRSAAVSGVS